MKSSIAFGALVISLASLAASAPALASKTYVNDAGQSAQLTHAMTHQGQDSSAAISTWNPDSNRYTSTGKARLVESFRQDHALGQSDAVSKTQPYIALAKGLQASPKTNFEVETSTYHDSEDRIGNPIDW